MGSGDGSPQGEGNGNLRTASLRWYKPQALEGSFKEIKLGEHKTCLNILREDKIPQSTDWTDECKKMKQNTYRKTKQSTWGKYDNHQGKQKVGWGKGKQCHVLQYDSSVKSHCKPCCWPNKNYEVIILGGEWMGRVACGEGCGGGPRKSQTCWSAVGSHVGAPKARTSRGEQSKHVL